MEVKREILKFDVFEADLSSDSIFLDLTKDTRTHLYRFLGLKQLLGMTSIFFFSFVMK